MGERNLDIEHVTRRIAECQCIVSHGSWDYAERAFLPSPSRRNPGGGTETPISEVQTLLLRRYFTGGGCR